MIAALTNGLLASFTNQKTNDNTTDEMATSDTETITKNKFDHTANQQTTQQHKIQRTTTDNSTVYSGWTRSIRNLSEHITKQSDRAATPTDKENRDRGDTRTPLAAKQHL